MTGNKEDSGYFVPAGLVNALIIAIFSSLIGIAGYMIVWNGQDAAFKQTVLYRLTNIENKVNNGILPRADERVKNLERWQDRHDREHEEDE